MPLRLRACTADGKYRSAVIEMLSMKDNAKAVPRLSKVSILALQAQPCGYASLDVTAIWCADVSLGNVLRQAAGLFKARDHEGPAAATPRAAKVLGVGIEQVGVWRRGCALQQAAGSGGRAGAKGEGRGGKTEGRVSE